MPSVTWVPLSGRYLSFEEREEIALLRAQGCGVGGRPRGAPAVRRQRFHGNYAEMPPPAAGIWSTGIGLIGRRHGRRQDRRWATSWSPEQIANRLRIDFPDDELMRISHEAIYQALYVQGRGALRRELCACLRTGRALRVPPARTQGRGKRFVTSEVMISKRPAEAGDRAVPGHWHGDLILGLGSSAIGTPVRTHDPLHHAATSAA